VIRRIREDKERGRARRNRRLGEEREKKDEEEEFEVDEVDDEERAATRRCRAMLTAASLEAWREVRWISAR